MHGNGEFKLVTHRRKRVAHGRTNCRLNASISSSCDVYEDSSDSSISCETLVGRLLEAEVELKNSLFSDNVFYYLKESLTALNVNGISVILCYGLGHFSHNKSSKYQLALLLSLKKHYRSDVYIYDPVFSSVEVQLLKQLDFNVIETNEEGKRVIGDTLTLVYMPHCSIHLINNFLFANWCRKLNRCILLTNSFSIVADNTMERNRSIPIDYILRVRPYVTEIALTNNFIHEEAFNDLNIHIFLEKDMNKIPQNFWNERQEPCYQDAETDYLTAKQTEEIRETMWPSNIKLLRSLIQEIRHVSSERNIKDHIVVRYILEQARSHRETSEVLCKAREELKNLAETYLCYLKSQRICKDIHVQYNGKGERSIRETADLIGFKLPHDPK